MKAYFSHGGECVCVGRMVCCPLVENLCHLTALNWRATFFCWSTLLWLPLIKEVTLMLFVAETPRGLDSPLCCLIVKWVMGIASIHWDSTEVSDYPDNNRESNATNCRVCPFQWILIGPALTRQVDPSPPSYGLARKLPTSAILPLRALNSTNTSLGGSTPHVSVIPSG